MNAFCFWLSWNETGLLKPDTVWSWTMRLAVMLRHPGMFLFTSAPLCWFGLEHTHHSSLSGLSAPWKTLSSQESNCFSPHYWKASFWFYFSLHHAINCSLDSWFLLVVPVFPNLLSPVQHLFRCCLSISAFPRSSASVLYGQCHKSVHQGREVGSSLLLLFTLGLETQADCVFNSEPNCYLRNAV